MQFQIKKRNGEVFDCLMDDEDWEKFKNIGIYIIPNKSKIPYLYFSSAYKQRSLSRYLMGDPSGFVVDHINGNTLDNRRKNLRICTQSENLRNSKKHIKKSSEYKGVSFVKKVQKYRASIRIKGHNFFIGEYKEEKDAALAYNKTALEYFGDYASLNDV